MGFFLFSLRFHTMEGIFPPFIFGFEFCFDLRIIRSGYHFVGRFHIAFCGIHGGLDFGGIVSAVIWFWFAHVGLSFPLLFGYSMCAKYAVYPEKEKSSFFKGAVSVS